MRVAIALAPPLSLADVVGSGTAAARFRVDELAIDFEIVLDRLGIPVALQIAVADSSHKFCGLSRAEIGAAAVEQRSDLTLRAEKLDVAKYRLRRDILGAAQAEKFLVETHGYLSGGLVPYVAH